MAEFGFVSDGTLKKLKAAAERKKALLSAMEVIRTADVEDMATVKRIVRAGAAQKVFSIGDQIIDDWTDSVGGTTYSVPYNIVSFDNVTLQDGEEVPGMWLQWHYATPFGMPFDAKEAFYYAAEGLSAGTYYFSVGVTAGKLTKGEVYEFTLENDVPEGGQLVFESDLTSVSPSGTNVNVYSSGSSRTVLESAVMTAVSEGSGTSLGEFTVAGSDSLNSIQRALYGYNRWSQSAIRQYLNSSAGIGEWWEPQNNFDRPPAELYTYPGFMTGIGHDLLTMIKKVKVTTALNTAGSQRGTEDTYDYFFLPSLQQMYVTPQKAGVEGDCFPYWKIACGGDTIKTNVTGVFPLIYGVNAQTTAQEVWLRSASLNYMHFMWYISASGTVSHARVPGKLLGCIPVCVIC